MTVRLEREREDEREDERDGHVEDRADEREEHLRLHVRRRVGRRVHLEVGALVQDRDREDRAEDEAEQHETAEVLRDLPVLLLLVTTTMNQTKQSISKSHLDTLSRKWNDGILIFFSFVNFGRTSSCKSLGTPCLTEI